MNKFIFPVALILLDLGAAFVYGLNGDVRKVIYWIAAAILNITVTFQEVKMCENLRVSKKEAIKAAEQLRYSDSVVERIKKAKNEPEITRILATARKNIEDQVLYF